MSAPTTVGTTITSFCSGASNATQATAQAAWATAFATLQTQATGNVVILYAGVDVASNSQGATFLYTFWSMCQYVSAV